MGKRHILCRLGTPVMLLAIVIWADAVSAEQSGWRMEIKPKVCVIPESRSQCEVDAEISWVGKQTANICLLSSEQDAVLQCWNNAIYGSSVESIISSRQVIFHLVPEGKDDVLAECVMWVVTVPEKRTRRRRRHIWSLL